MDKKLKLAVIGKPIGHSKSPEIHQDFANQFDEKIEFRKDEVTSETLETWLTDFFKDGGKGVSITLPLKEEALKSGLINEKDYEKIVDPKKMTYPA